VHDFLIIDERDRDAADFPLAHFVANHGFEFGTIEE
jgi:hypothetical protein